MPRTAVTRTTLPGAFTLTCVCPMLSYVVAAGMAAITLTATWAAGANASTVASKKGSIPINRGDLNEWWAAMDSLRWERLAPR